MGAGHQRESTSRSSQQTNGSIGHGFLLLLLWRLLSTQVRAKDQKQE